MSTIINGYLVEYTMGFEFAEVRKIGYVDQFGRLMDCKFVFRGTWEECEKYAEEH